MSSATADVRRMEAVGAVPVRAAAPVEGSLRDAALKRALSDAVVRVSRDLLAPQPEEAVAVGVGIGEIPGEEGAQGEDETSLASRLEEALGDDPLDYAVRFRILEDQGERAALFIDDPEVESEYVIVVEVYVDTERVSRRLASRGFELLPAGDAAQVRILLELLGVERFGAFERVRAALAADSRVRSVVPVEMERGRALLEVDSSHQPEELLERLVQVVPPELELEPVSVEEGRLVLRVYLPPDGLQEPARPGDRGN